MCIKQSSPCSRDNAILFWDFPYEKDNYSLLACMAELCALDSTDMRIREIIVARGTRPVHLILMADYSFTISFGGHAGATCRSPRVYCGCLARPFAISNRLLPRYADYVTTNHGSRAALVPRTLLQQQEKASLHADGPLATIVDPPAAARPCTTRVGH